MHLQLFIISFLLQIVSVILYTDNDSQSNRILSRKKRYIVFPEGSSFQLVYCLTMPTHGMGSIFTMGLTAALAWELPHDPIDFKKEKNTGDADKRVDKPTNNTIGVATPPLTDYRSPWSAYVRPSHQYITNESFRPKNEEQSTKYQTMNGGETDWGHLPAYRDGDLYRKHGVVHRRTRRELFGKIEKFFEAQNKDGMACLLKALCEVNQTSGSEKGTFVEEILRAIFTWIPADQDEIEHRSYDNAATHKGNCTEKYPTCTQSVWNPFF